MERAWCQQLYVGGCKVIEKTSSHPYKETKEGFFSADISTIK